MRPWVKRWGFAIGLVALLLTLGSFLLDGFWFFDVLASLRVQGAIGAAVLALLAALFGRWYATGLLAAAAAINVALMLPFMLAEPKRAEPDTESFSVLFQNMARNTLETFPLINFIRQRKPDLLAFTELTAWDVENLRKSLPDYPYSVGDPGVFGVVIFSRRPIRGFQVTESEGGVAGRIFDFRICDRIEGTDCVAILAQHAARPFGSVGNRNREANLMALARQASFAGEENAVKGRVIVVGDFNMTSWNGLYDRALEAGNLTDAFAGGLPHSTWFSTFAAAGLAIDHIWVGPNVGVRTTEIGPLSGSDHLAVYAELALDFYFNR